MGLFSRRNSEENLENVKEDVEELTLFEMANIEEEVKNKPTQISGGWAIAFSGLTEEEKRAVIITKEQISDHFIRHNNRYYLKKIAVNNAEIEDERGES